jgi:hypothetical protein
LSIRCSDSAVKGEAASAAEAGQDKSQARSTCGWRPAANGTERPRVPHLQQAMNGFRCTATLSHYCHNNKIPTVMPNRPVLCGLPIYFCRSALAWPINAARELILCGTQAVSGSSRSFLGEASLLVHREEDRTCQPGPLLSSATGRATTRTDSRLYQTRCAASSVAEQ